MEKQFLHSFFSKPSVFIPMMVLIQVCLHTIDARGQSNYYQYTQENFRQAELFYEVIDLKNPDLKRINAVVFYLTNEERAKKKLNILQYHASLEASATLHSNSMAEKNFFSHDNPRERKFRTPEDRAKYVGIVNPYLAENIIESFLIQYEANKTIVPMGNGMFRYPKEKDPIKAHTYLSLGEAMLDKWMNSPGHKANILRPQAVQFGCGAAHYSPDKNSGIPTIVATQNFQLYEPLRVNN